MNFCTKIFIQFSKAVLSSHGFKRTNASYIRVVNDVIQVIRFEVLSSGRACRVVFSAIPLCIGIDRKSIISCPYCHELRRFEPTAGLLLCGWEYDRKAEESIHACMAEIMRYIETYLLPFFDRANSCRTALPELIALEQRFLDNRKISLAWAGMTDHAQPGMVPNLLDSAKRYMALKNGDYEFAEKYFTALVQQNIQSYQSVLEGGYLSEEALRGREARIKKLQEEIALLKARDTDYFDRLLQENENFTKANLIGLVK